MAPLFASPPTCISSVLLVRYSTLASSLREIFHYLHQPSTWGNQRGELTNSVSESSPRELAGVHPTCLLKKTYSSFEEAHHWNIQAKFYSVKDPHIVICMDDDLYGAQGIEDEVRVWISQKE